MSKVKNSIEKTINLIFSVLFITIIFYAGLSTYNQIQLQDTIKKQMQSTLKTTAEYMASQINGDEYAKIKTGEENTPLYKKYHTLLNENVAKNPDILWIYTFNRVTSNAKAIYWVIDNTFFTDKEASPIGEVYDTPSPTNLKGLEETCVEADYVTDEWGTFISGYSPIRDSKGIIVGAVGVDITKKTFLARQNMVSLIINIVLLLLLFTAAIMLTIIMRGIIRDLEKLTSAANNISKGNLAETINIKRSDEIGNLADSFSRMIASVKILMMDQEEKK